MKQSSRHTPCAATIPETTSPLATARTARRRHTECACYFTLLAFVAFTSTASAQTSTLALRPDAGRETQVTLPPVLQQVRFDQRLNEQVPLNLEFRDEAGNTVKLADYFGEKPVILVLAYYRCPMLCTLVLNGLVRGLLDVPFTPGKEFNVVTVSFDARETPAMAAAKKKMYLERYGRHGAEAGWHFLTGKQDAIDKLTDAVGFHCTYDAARDEFIHASGIVLLTPQGKVSRYFYDVSYSGRDLRLGLVEASENKIGSPVDQVLLFCFHYDPTLGKYGATIMNFVRVGGVVTVIVLGSFIGWMFRSERKKARQNRSSGVLEQWSAGY